MNQLEIMKNIARKIIERGIIDNENKRKYMFTLIKRAVNEKTLSSRKDTHTLISVMAKIISEKIKEKYPDGNDYHDEHSTYQETMHDFMNFTLSKGDNSENALDIIATSNLSNGKFFTDDVPVPNMPDTTQIQTIVGNINNKLDMGFYRHKYITEYINLDTFSFLFNDIVGDSIRFNLVTQYNTQGDILIKKPLSNITRIRVMPFRIPHYTLYAPAINRSPLTTTSDDFFVGDYLHVKTPATRVIGIQIDEILDKIKSSINTDNGSTTMYNNGGYSNIRNSFKVIKNSLLADCTYENNTYDGTYQAMTTLVTPRNNGYIYMQSSIDKLDSLTITLNDTVSNIFLPSPAIEGLSFTALGVSQILVTTSNNGTALMPIGVEQKAYITDFNLDYNNIDVGSLSVIDKPTFVKNYLIQYLNTKGVPVTVMRYNNSTNQMIINIVPPPYYSGVIYSLNTFKINIISRRVLIPLQIEQLRKEVTKTVNT